MTCPVIVANGKEDAFIDIERFRQLLREDVNDIVIGIRSVIELGSKRALPFLRLQDAMCIGSMEEKAFKIQLAKSPDSGSRFHSCIHVVTDTIRPFNEPHFRIKVWSNFSMLVKALKPVRFV